MNEIKDKTKYFQELKDRLKNSFHEIFEDEDLELNKHLNTQLYSTEEFEIFKKQFKIMPELDDKRKRYVFEHTRKYSEVYNLPIGCFIERMILSEVKRTGSVLIILQTLIDMRNDVLLYGFVQKFLDDRFVEDVYSYTPSTLSLDFDLSVFEIQDREHISKIINYAKETKDKREQIRILIGKFAEIEFEKIDTKTINVFDYDLSGNRINEKSNKKPEFHLSLSGKAEGINYFSDDVVKFWENFGKEKNHLDSINEYLDKTLKKYNELVLTFQPDSMPCKYIKTIVYWLAYLGIGEERVKAHMEAIKDADVSWAVGTEKIKKASFYGNSKFIKAFSSYHSFLNSKHNPHKDFINNKEHERMNENAMAMNKLFNEIGLNALGLEKVLDNLYIIKNIADIIEILDERLIVSVNVGDLIKGFVSSIVNAIAQILDFSLTQSFQQLFYLKVIPWRGRQLSISDIYNYIYLLREIINQSDVKGYSEINSDLLIENSMEVLGTSIGEFKEIGYGAYDKTLNNMSNIVFFSKNFYKSYKNSKEYYTVKEDLPVLYTLIEFALEKRVVKGDSYAKKNIILGNRSEIYNLLQSLTVEEVVFVLDKLDIREIFDEKNYIMVGDTFVRKTNKRFNSNYIQNLTEGTFLYQEFEKKQYFELSILANNITFKTTFNDYIQYMVEEYFVACKHNKDAIFENTYADNDLGDFDDFLARITPSLLEVASLFGLEEETKEALVEMLDSILYVFTNILFEKVLLELRKQINLILEHANETLQKEKDKIDEKLDFLNTTVEFDLNLNAAPMIQKFKTTLGYFEEILVKIPKSISGCFDGSGYGMAEELLIEKPKIDINKNMNPPHFRNPETPEEINKKIEDIKYDKKNEWVIVWHNNLGEEIGRIKKEIKSDVTTINKSTTPASQTIIEKVIEETENKPIKIVYDKGEISLIYDKGQKEVIIDRNSELRYPIYKGPKHVNTNTIRNKTDEIISKNLSKNDLARLIEIKNFIERAGNLEYYSLIKERKKIKEKMDGELKLPMSNFNKVKEYEKLIDELTNKINNVKNNFVLNSNADEIEILKFDKNLKVNLDSNRYRDLNDFFEKKVEFINNIEDMLSNTKNKDNYLSTYQITQLLR